MLGKSTHQWVPSLWFCPLYIILSMVLQLNSTLKHVSRKIWGDKIGNPVTEYWFIFDHHCLDWQFDLSFLSLVSCARPDRPPVVQPISGEKTATCDFSNLDTCVLQSLKNYNYTAAVSHTFMLEGLIFFIQKCWTTGCLWWMYMFKIMLLW